VTVLGGAVSVSVSVAGAWVSVVEPESESEELEVLGEMDSEGLVDEDVPLQPARTKVSPTTTLEPCFANCHNRLTTEVLGGARLGRVSARLKLISR